MRSSFTIDQMIAITADRVHFDLHNDFEFVGFEYRPSERKARLEWTRGSGDWISKALPKKLALLFDEVANFVAKRRDDEMPFSEDSCVASIGYLPPDFSTDFSAVCGDFRSDDEHLSIKFQSGSGVKIWAGSVTHESDLPSKKLPLGPGEERG